MERGPRQRIVAYLGDISRAESLGVKQAALEQLGSWQSRLFDEDGQPEWVKVNDDRLYRALDSLLPHKSEFEKQLKERLGDLFQLDYDLRFY